MFDSEYASQGVLTRQQLADYLAVSLRTVDRLDATGRIPTAIRLGHCKRWRRAEIEDWLAAGSPDRQSWEATKAVKP